MKVLKGRNKAWRIQLPFRAYVAGADGDSQGVALGWCVWPVHGAEIQPQDGVDTNGLLTVARPFWHGQETVPEPGPTKRAGPGRPAP
jgi:hypothetical protein